MSSMGPSSPAPDAYSDWDGVPRDELPLRLTFGIDLIVILERRFPAGKLLADTLNRVCVRHIRGADIDVNERGDASVALWIPAFEDQRSENRERDEPTEHVPISESERWEIAEVAFAALGAADSDRIIHFGFLTPESSFALDWHEWCRHYPHPPEYALGYWDYDAE